MGCLVKRAYKALFFCAFPAGSKKEVHFNRQFAGRACSCYYCATIIPMPDPRVKLACTRYSKAIPPPKISRPCWI